MIGTEPEEADVTQALDAFAEAFFLHTVEGHNRVKKVRMNS
ncbi:unnamed protein product [Ascophyllum nodosum]